MVNAGTVQVKLFADVKQFQTGMASATASMGKMTKGIQNFAKMSVLAFGAVTAASAKMATDFDKRLREISTLIIGVTEKDIKNMSREIRDLANMTGKALDDLGKAKYDIISAGFTGVAESAQLLNTSARLAVGGVTSVTNAADLLTSALNSWQQSGLEAEKAADILFTTVRLGKTTMDELVGSVGRVFPTAKTLGASLADVGAAMATITAGGIKTYEAATYLNQAFTKLGAPSDKAARNMKLYGIEVIKANDGSFDLLKTIKQFQGYDLEQMRRFFPEIRAVKAILAMTNNMKFLERAIKDTGNAAGATQVAFKKMSKSWSVGLSKNVMKLKSELIDLGDNIMPTVVEVFDDFISSFDINPQKIISIIKPFVKLVSDLLPIVVNLLPIVVKLSIAYLAINAAIKVGTILNIAYEWSMAAMVGTTNLLIGAMELLKIAFAKMRTIMMASLPTIGIMTVLATIVAGIHSATKAWGKYKKKRDEALNLKTGIATGDIISGADIPINYKINVSAYFDKNAEKFLELTREEKTRKQMAGHSNKLRVDKLANFGDPMYAYTQQAFDKIALDKQQAETAKNFDFSARAYSAMFGDYADDILGAYKDNFVLKLTEYNPPDIFSLLGFRDEEEYKIKMNELNKWVDSFDADNIKTKRIVLGTGGVGEDLGLDKLEKELENVLSLAIQLNKEFNIDFAKSMGVDFKPLYDAIQKMKDAGIDYNMSADKLLNMKNIKIDTDSFILLRELIENMGFSLDEFFDIYEKGLKKSTESVVTFGDELISSFANIGDSISSIMADSFTEIIMSGRVAAQELEKYNKGLTNNFRTAAEIREDAWSNMWNNILVDTITAIGEMLIKYGLLTAGLIAMNLISGGMLSAALGGSATVKDTGKAVTGFWKFIAGLFTESGGKGFTDMFVKDAVITPGGQVVHTAPDDYIMAMKDPASFGKNVAGGGDIYNISISTVDDTGIKGLIEGHKQAFSYGIGKLVNSRDLVISTGGQKARASY